MSIKFGASDDDLINGTNKSDIIFGFAGNDTIYGLLGSDLLFGGSGNDVVVGDTLNAIPGTVIGGVLTKIYGSDLLFGGTGDDMLIGDHGGYDIPNSINSVTFLSYYGHDILIGGIGNDILIGDNGFRTNVNIDVIETTYLGGDILDGGAGDDIVAGRSYTDISLQGTFNLTRLINADTLQGGDGNDVLTPRLFDTIHLGEAFDGTPTGLTFISSDISVGNVMDGGSGNDFLAGDRANALLIFTNTIFSGLAKDGNDVIQGGSGNDTLLGDRNSQTVFQAGINDLSALTNVRGDDHLDGGTGNDILVGDDSALNIFYERISNVGAASVGGTVASGHGNYLGNDTLQGGLGDDIIWGDSMTTAGGVNNTPTSGAPVVFNGTFTAAASVSAAGTAVGSDTFVFDVAQGWDRDVLMDFNGISPNITVGSPDTNPTLAGNNSGPMTLVQMDNLLFKGVGDLNHDSVLDYHDVDMLIFDILPTASEATVTAGGYFDRATRTYVDPSDSSVHTLDVQGASHSANAFTILDGRVEVQFSNGNGNSIIFADVLYSSITDTNSIANLYATPADAAAHIVVM